MQLINPLDYIPFFEKEVILNLIVNMILKISVGNVWKRSAELFISGTYKLLDIATSSKWEIWLA